MYGRIKNNQPNLKVSLHYAYIFMLLLCLALRYGMCNSPTMRGCCLMASKRKRNGEIMR